jgi:hypothetical protein
MREGADRLVDPAAQIVRIDLGLTENINRQAIAVHQEHVKEMKGLYLGVALLFGVLLCPKDRLLGLFGVLGSVQVRIPFWRLSTADAEARTASRRPGNLA